MANEIRLPDIGDFKDVPVIEILVQPGQRVQKDVSILTLESDKATMDVPAPSDGVIGAIHVKIGDKVSQGDLLATYADAGGAEVAAPKAAAPPAAGARSAAEIQEPAPKAVARWPRRRSPPPTQAGRRTSRPKSSFWAQAPAATRPPSAPPISGRASFWSRSARPSAACASMSAASRPRRCCMSPRSSTRPGRWARTG